MSHGLSLNKAPEILELLWFKNNSLSTSELFLKAMIGQKQIHLLEDDIDLTIREIKDLKDVLIHSAG